MSATPKDYSPDLYELYARAVVRFAFYPFDNSTDSSAEASMFDQESILSVLTNFADHLVAEQLLILHPAITDFSRLNLFESVNNHTYSHKLSIQYANQ